jgi:hypothetical protein
MRDDDSARPSLLLARHDLAHREHLPHQHNKFHHRQAAATTVDVTEVIQTVSVVQQIDVDSNGSTFSILTVPDTTEASSPALTDATPLATTTSATASPAVTPGNQVTSSSASQAATASLSSTSSQSTSMPTSTPSISSISSLSSTFPSLALSSNSTCMLRKIVQKKLATNISSVISSSSSLNPFSNSSVTSLSSSRSSLTYLTSSSLTSDDLITSTTASFYSTDSSPGQSTATGVAGGIAGGTAAATGSAASSTATASGSKESSAPPTPVVVGSVVASVAGVSIIILCLLFVIKWYKKNQSRLSLGDGDTAAIAAGDGTVSGGAPPGRSGGMTERRSIAYAVPAALASLTGYKRSSQKTERTVSSTAGSERGFYRVSGRKLPSVFQSGGDGYGGGIAEGNTLSGSSFYRDSDGFYGGPGTPTVPPIQTSTTRDSGVPVLRPSPARTPVTEHGPFSTFVPPPLNVPPRRPDVLGRSHPSQDGSRGSRFTEEV